MTKKGEIGRNQTTSHFFAVPAGTPAFKVDMAAGGPAKGAGQVRFLRFHPYGVGFDSNSTVNCYNPAVVPGCNATSRTVANPQTGVWEVTVEARRTSDVAEAPYTITASVLGASVSPSPDTIASATKGKAVTRSYALTNLFGAFTGKAEGTALGSAHRERKTIGNLETKSYDVVVPAGSTSLRATIGRTSDPSADLDLFLQDCTGGSCRTVGQSADGDSEESVTYAPATGVKAGTYRVVVDGYAVPSGTTAYDYVDVFANPSFGSIAVTDGNAERRAGSSWSVPAAVTAQEAPAPGRVLLGNVRVVTDGNVLVGSGDVVVKSVE